MNTVSSPPKQRVAVSHLFAGVIGGLLVLVVGSILIATNVIDTGDTNTTVVRQPAISQPASNTAASSGGRTVQDIYKTEGQGVVYIQSEGVGGGTDLFGQQQSGTATGS